MLLSPGFLIHPIFHIAFYMNVNKIRAVKKMKFK